MQLQAKPAYYGVINDAKMLPGHGLKFKLAQTRGQHQTSAFTLTATNGDVGPAYATQITGFTLAQLFGKHCTPTITPTTSLNLGDIATSGTASASIIVDFSNCNADAAFLVTAPWTSSVYHTGTFTQTIEVNADNRGKGTR